MAPILHRFARHAWRGVVLVVGLVLIGAGLVMMVTPGPGIAAILAGLALLSTEFAWAKRVLDWVRRRFAAARAEVRRRATRRSDPPAAEGEVGAAGSPSDDTEADAHAVADADAVAEDLVAEPRSEGGSGGSARTEVGVVKPTSEVPAEGSPRNQVEDRAARQSATS